MGHRADDAAGDALVDMHMFAAIEVLCENALFRTPRGREAAKRIARVCKQQGAAQLRAFDRSEDADA